MPRRLSRFAIAAACAVGLTLLGSDLAAEPVRSSPSATASRCADLTRIQAFARAKGLRRLTERELRRAFGHVRARYRDRDERLSDAPTSEVYARTGDWILEGGLSRKTGRFEIRKDTITITDRRTVVCRAAFRSKDGALFISPSSGRSDYLTPIALVPLN